MLTHPGKREELIAILDDGIREMPGCKSYIIAKDPSDENAVWITEVWESQAEHLDSLKLPQVQAAIAKGRLMIDGIRERFETIPIGGFSRFI